MIQNLKRTWSASGQSKSFFILLVTYILSGIVSLFVSSALGTITESILSLKLDAVKMALILFVCGHALLLLFEYSANRRQTKTITETRNRFKSITVSRLLNSSHAYRQSLEQGDLIGRLNQDVSSIGTATGMSVQLIKSIVLLVILSGGLWMIDVRLCIVFVVPFVLIFILQLYLSKHTIKHILPWKEAMGKTAATLQDIMNNRTTVRMLNLYKQSMEWIDQCLISSLRRAVKGIGTLYVIQIPTSLLSQSALFVISMLGTYWTFSGDLSIAQLVSAIAIVQLAGEEFNVFVNMIQNIPQLMASSERIFPIWDAEVEQFGTYDGEGIEGAPFIEFRDVHFTYPNTDMGSAILNGLSFIVNENENIGLVGSSGCGKSTIFKLLSGVYSPDSGLVLYKGVPVQEWKKEVLRSQMTLVTQNTDLFNRSIYDNFKVLHPHIERETVTMLLSKVALDSLIKSEEGLDFIVGEKGNRLSGGQRQRLSIARSLYRTSELLLLDEVTSALDVQTEKVVQKSIDSLSKATSQMVIAHRLSTLESCSRILVMDSGVLVESGSHEALIKQKGLYYNLQNKAKQEGDVS